MICLLEGLRRDIARGTGRQASRVVSARDFATLRRSRRVDAMWRRLPQTARSGTDLRAVAGGTELAMPGSVFDMLRSALCEVSDLVSSEPAPAPPPSAATAPRIDSDWDLGQSLGDLGRGLAEEGAAGLLDPLGVIDRQHAGRQLAGRFEVVDPAHVGARLPNQVTEDEYRDITRTFSDIRRGRADIRLDPAERGCSDPQAFEDAMMSDIADIMQTESGRELVGALADNKGPDEHGDEVSRITTLSPRFRDGLENSDNAETRNDDDDAFGFLRHDGTPSRGSTAVEIDINPGVTVNDEIGGSQLRSDVALYHEMVHAYDHSHGISDIRDVEDGDATWGKLLSGDVSGAWDALFERDHQVAWDARQGVSRSEHAAVGLGLYEGRRLSENTYRGERTAVADSGLGRVGDADMPQRNRYDGFTPDLL
jgi:hypothetical protein